MYTEAAILIEANRLIVDQIELPKIGPGQVLVEILYSGVCHTQLLEISGAKGPDPYLPHLLGHEGSGIVREIGSEVKKVKEGDRVILSWMKGSGANIAGSVYNWKGTKVNSGAITTFSKFSVISENRLTSLPEKIEAKQAALLGCALPTGLGVVFNTARPKPGQSIAIFGCGGIGLCAIQAASIAGCYPIIAIDLLDSKLEVAKKFGATQIINSSKEDPVKALAEIGGMDFCIEATGSPSVMEQALQSVKNQGGKAIVVGNAHSGKKIALNPLLFNQGKHLLGTWGGDNNPDKHFPRYCNLIANNRFQLTPFLEKTYSLNSINTAVEDLKKGASIRPLIDMSLS